MSASKVTGIMSRKNKTSNVKPNSCELRKKRAEMVTSIPPETLSSEPHFRILELACPKCHYFTIPGESRFKFIKTQLQFLTYNSRRSEEAIKLSPLLRQVEAARSVPISSTDVLDKTEPKEARLVVFPPPLHLRKTHKCSARIHTLAIPRQNTKEIRKKQNEEYKKIYMISKSALKAKPTARLLELAKPKRVHGIKVKTTDTISKSTVRAMPSSHLIPLSKSQNVQEEKKGLEMKEKDEILEKEEQETSLQDTAPDIIAEEKLLPPLIEEASLKESLSYTLMSETVSELLESVESMSLSSVGIEEQEELSMEAIETREESDILLRVETDETIKEEYVMEEVLEEETLYEEIIEEVVEDEIEEEIIRELISEEEATRKEYLETGEISDVGIEEIEDISLGETVATEEVETEKEKIEEKSDIGIEEIETEDISSVETAEIEEEEIKKEEMEKIEEKADILTKETETKEISSENDAEIDKGETKKEQKEEISVVEKEKESVKVDDQNAEDKVIQEAPYIVADTTGYEMEGINLEPPPPKDPKYKRRMSYLQLPQLSVEVIKHFDEAVHVIQEIAEGEES